MERLTRQIVIEKLIRRDMSIMPEAELRRLLASGFTGYSRMNERELIAKYVFAFSHEVEGQFKMDWDGSDVDVVMESIYRVYINGVAARPYDSFPSSAETGC